MEMEKMLGCDFPAFLLSRDDFFLILDKSLLLFSKCASFTSGNQSQILFSGADKLTNLCLYFHPYQS